MLHARVDDPALLDSIAPDRPDRSPEGRSGGLPGAGSSVPSRPGSPDGYAAASQAGGRGIDGLPGYGRGSAQPGSGGRSGGQHSNRSSRGALRGGGRSAGRGGAAASGRSGGVRDDVYPPGRGAPGQSGPSGRGGIRDGSESPWGERGTATRGRGTSRFGTGVRDIRDDLRDRLRRNGVSGDWDEPDGRGPQRRAGGGDWGGPDGPDGREPRRKGSWWRHWTWKKVLTLAAAVFGVFIIAASAGRSTARSKLVTTSSLPTRTARSQPPGVCRRRGRYRRCRAAGGLGACACAVSPGCTSLRDTAR